jgi:TnpA family transposase
MCRLLGFRFAPRIRDLKEKRLYALPSMTVPPELASLAAGAINLRVISDHWFELPRLALSIKTGTVTASVILRKLAAYPRQNGLAFALRELGKLERTFFTVQLAIHDRRQPYLQCFGNHFGNLFDCDRSTASNVHRLSV